MGWRPALIIALAAFVVAGFVYVFVRTYDRTRLQRNYVPPQRRDFK